jgi:hypothetical protein
MLNKLYLNAGQMKAGTTFLYRLLIDHPEIYFSPEKELHWLSQMLGEFKLLSDHVKTRKAKEILHRVSKSERGVHQVSHIAHWVTKYLRPNESPNWYEQIFDSAKENQFAADFSNLTCTIPLDGLKQINGLANEVKVTYCIRSPIERAVSHMKFHLKFSQHEHDLNAMRDQDILDLLHSVNIQPQGQSDIHIQKLASAFGDNFAIIQCENMWADPNHTYSAVCDFLGIESKPNSDLSDLEPVNKGPQIGSLDRINKLVESELRAQIESNIQILEKLNDRIII